MSTIKCVRFVSIWMISLVFISRDNLSHQVPPYANPDHEAGDIFNSLHISSMHLTSCNNSGMVFPVHTTGNNLVSRPWSCAALGSFFWPSLENLFSLLSQRTALLLLIQITLIDITYSFTIWYLCPFCVSVEKLPWVSSVFIAANFLVQSNTLSWFPNFFLMCKSFHALGKHRRKHGCTWNINK